jgi:hypothetical protein
MMVFELIVKASGQVSQIHDLEHIQRLIQSVQNYLNYYKTLPKFIADEARKRLKWLQARRESLLEHSQTPRITPNHPRKVFNLMLVSFRSQAFRHFFLDFDPPHPSS